MKPLPHVSEEKEEPPGVLEEESLGVEEEGGVVRQTTHISTKSSDEASFWREGGGAVRRWLELPTSWCEGEGAVRLKGEANLS
jgi:hypothetical protein